MRSLRFALAACAAPLALALASCGSGDATGTVAQAEPVATVAAPQGGDWNEVVSRTDSGGWLVGNPDAPITLLEFGSLTCPACASFSEASAQPLHADYIASGRVNFEFRSLLIHGVVDLLLTRLLECGSMPAAVPLAHQLWADNAQVVTAAQTNSAQAEQAQTLPEDQRYFAMAQAFGLVDYFAARGISTEQARACLSDAEAVRKVAEVTQEAANASQVNSTPTFFINGNRLDGTNWPSVEAALQQAGAR